MSHSHPPFLSSAAPRITFLTLLLLLAGLGAAAAQPAAKPVAYEKEIRPLLTARCYACHGNGSQLGGFQIDSRDGILAGSQATHPVVVPGNSAKSYLVRLVSGEVPGKVMPPRGQRLTKAEIDLLRAWIDQGVSFGAESGAAAWKAPLAPRQPPLPPARPGLTNPVDRLLEPYFQAHKIRPKPLVDDRTYARRVYLDLVGLLPPRAELHAFLADRSPDKRARLARRLLDDNRNYAEHWLTFWNDMLRNDYAGTGYIDGGRTQITGWLYDALANNMPYDRLVRELVNPTPESAGFVKGIVWRGVVNASQTPQMQAAQNISQVFMGVNLKCASCHDSFISTWKLADAYGMAGIYADGPLEMVRCDHPTGKIAPIKFLYPELGSIDAAAPKEQRMAQLAAILTSSKNGRLSRTLVNRLWARLMGRGLVEPTDDMDARPWDPELLDWLAAGFQDGVMEYWSNGVLGSGKNITPILHYSNTPSRAPRPYDLRALLYLLVTSRAYQLPSVPQASERAKEFVFSGPVVKRMSAEQFVDGVAALTGVWPPPAGQFRIAKGQPMLPTRSNARILFRTGVMKSGSVDVDVDVTGAQVLSLIVTDAGNGANTDWADWAEPRLVGPAGEIKLTGLKWRFATTGYGEVRIGKNVVEKPLRLGEKTYADGIGTHANSVITYLLPPGVTRFRAVAGPDTAATEERGSETSIQLFVVAGDRSLIETRAALALADPLMRALGRPNREQVVTERSTVATTLQALELTNGQSLADVLAQGAEAWLSGGVEAWKRGRPGAQAVQPAGVGAAREGNNREGEARLPSGREPVRGSPGELVNALYEAALGRLPSAAERQLALEMVGNPIRKAGIEDLLWALVMLPEFQLVY